MLHDTLGVAAGSKIVTDTVSSWFVFLRTVKKVPSCSAVLGGFTTILSGAAAASDMVICDSVNISLLYCAVQRSVITEPGSSLNPIFTLQNGLDTTPVPPVPEPTILVLESALPRTDHETARFVAVLSTVINVSVAVKRIFSCVLSAVMLLYPNLEYACAAGMSFITTDTKGDLYRNYAGIAKKYYGYDVAVIDLRNPTRSDGNNMLHLVNKYMDAYLADPDNLALKARAEKYAKIISKTIISSGNTDSASYGQNAFYYDSAKGHLTAYI